MLVSALFSFLNISISYIFFSCTRLSPLFNMIVSVPIVLFWTVAMGLLIYNMYGTLGRACSAVNWANSDGISVCNSYKAFFAFVVIGWLCQAALLFVDFKAKRTESALGKYDKMEEDKNASVKLASLENSRNNSHLDVPYGIQVDDFNRGRANSAGSQHDSRYASPYGAPSAYGTPSPYSNERTALHGVDDYFYQTPQQQQRAEYQAANYYQQPTYDGMRLR
jgi:hypothetical protein